MTVGVSFSELLLITIKSVSFPLLPPLCTIAKPSSNLLSLSFFKLVLNVSTFSNLSKIVSNSVFINTVLVSLLEVSVAILDTVFNIELIVASTTVEYSLIDCSTIGLIFESKLYSSYPSSNFFI